MKPTENNGFSRYHWKTFKEKKPTGGSFVRILSSLFSSARDKRKSKQFYDDLSDDDSDINYDNFDYSSDEEESNSVNIEDLKGLDFHGNMHRADSMEREANVDFDSNNAEL